MKPEVHCVSTEPVECALAAFPGVRIAQSLVSTGTGGESRRLTDEHPAATFVIHVTLDLACLGHIGGLDVLPAGSSLTRILNILCRYAGVRFGAFKRVVDTYLPSAADLYRAGAGDYYTSRRHKNYANGS